MREFTKMDRRIFTLLCLFLIPSAPVIAGPIPDPGPFTPISQIQPWVEATFQDRAVFQHLPHNARALVYFFHGTTGNANIVERLETVLILNELSRRGFGFVSVSSEDRSSGAQWNTADPLASNADFQRLLALRQQVISASPHISQSTPIYTAGFSNGGAMAQVFGDFMRDFGLNFRAAAVLDNAVDAPAPTLDIRVPTFIQVLENDRPPHIGTGPDRPTLLQSYFDLLVADGVDTEFHLGLQKILTSERFNRIPEIAAVPGLDAAIFNLLVNGNPALGIPGPIAPDGLPRFSIFQSDQFLSDLATGNGSTLDNLLSMHIATPMFARVEVTRQIRTTWAVHQISGEFAEPLANFFEAQFPLAVPEPGTLALFGLGLIGLGFARRKKAA